jgi:hypothetical protein
MLQLASIDLHYAQAEITKIGTRESILRSLEHVRQAEACLIIAMASFDTPAVEGAKAPRPSL